MNDDTALSAIRQRARAGTGFTPGQADVDRATLIAMVDRIAGERDQARAVVEKWVRRSNENLDRIGRQWTRADAERKRADQADAVTAETKRLMERRTTTLRERAERAEAAARARIGTPEARAVLRALVAPLDETLKSASDAAGRGDRATLDYLWRRVDQLVQRARRAIPDEPSRIIEPEPDSYVGGLSVRTAEPAAEPVRDACPHCPDGHTPPARGSQPWGAYVGPERDGDGQPTTIHVMRTGGAHVAESDARWVREQLDAAAERGARAERAVKASAINVMYDRGREPEVRHVPVPYHPGGGMRT